VQNLIEAISALVPAPPVAPDRSAAFAEPKRFDPLTLDRLEIYLADFVGPVAGSLIRARNGKATSLADLCEQVSREIPSEPERKKFLARCRTGLELGSLPRG